MDEEEMIERIALAAYDAANPLYCAVRLSKASCYDVARVALQTARNELKWAAPDVVAKATEKR